MKSLPIIRAAVIGLSFVFFGTTSFSADTNTTIIGKQLAKKATNSKDTHHDKSLRKEMRGNGHPEQQT